jgi:hypothetical protein
LVSRQVVLLTENVAHHEDDEDGDDSKEAAAANLLADLTRHDARAAEAHQTWPQRGANVIRNCQQSFERALKFPAYTTAQCCCNNRKVRPCILLQTCSAQQQAHK